MTNAETTSETDNTGNTSKTPIEEMSFFDHLDELRRRVVFALVGLVVGCVIAGYFSNEIMDGVLLAPAINSHVRLQNMRPFGQMFLLLKVAFTAGFIISFPWILWQLWQFVAPGLYENEQKWARKITFYTTLCFAVGISFAYFLMIPNMMSFSANTGSSNIENIIEINEYYGFITTTLIGAGLIFELPMIAYVLARFGLITPSFLRKYRRHAVVIILVIAAVLTPTPDPVNQMMFAVPLYILFELSILITALALRQKNRADNERQAATLR